MLTDKKEKEQDNGSNTIRMVIIRIKILSIERIYGNITGNNQTL